MQGHLIFGLHMVRVCTLHVTSSRTKFEELNMEKSWTGNAFLTLSNYLKCTT